MGNSKENEDESAAQPVPIPPLERDDPVMVDAAQGSLEQVDQNPNPNPSSSPAHKPAEGDKPVLHENGKPASPTEAAPCDDIIELKSTTEQPHQGSPSQPPLSDAENLLKTETVPAADNKCEAILTPESKSETPAGEGNSISKSEAFASNETEIPEFKMAAAPGTEICKSGTFVANTNGTGSCKSEVAAVSGIDSSKSQTSPSSGAETPTPNLEISKPAVAAKLEHSEAPESKFGHDVAAIPNEHDDPPTPHAASSKIKTELENVRCSNDDKNKLDMPTAKSNGNPSSNHWFLLDDKHDGSESGTEEEQLEFMKELDNFFRERSMEFKPPKFYGEGLNCLKLWRAVMKLGGYDKVTSCKLWRQVGESFKPPKTCTTVSWTFRGFYEKALLDYERHKISGGELAIHVAPNSEPMNVDNQASGSGRARRDAAARAMQGWHEQRLIGHGEVSYPIIKDKSLVASQKREKQIKSLGLLKRKQSSYMEDAVKAARTKSSKSQLDVDVVDIGPPADWVKINVQRTKECFEVYALVPGLLREEVRVQSDPAGRLVISGEPEHPDNPWGVTPFKKVVSLPSRIDPHQTSAVVTLHGQLLVRVPFEQSD